MIHRPYVLLGKGLNVFSAVVEDLDDFLAVLRSEGVDVRKTNRLDGLEAVPNSIALDYDETGTLLIEEEGPSDDQNQEDESG